MPPPSPDPFDVLGVEPRFDLTPAQLRAAFLQKSGVLHPDVASDDPDAEARAAALNLAKRTLDDPETRAEALLERLGGPRKEQDRSLPPYFLQEMLEVREEIEAAAATRDQAAISRWENWAENRRAGHIEAVNKLFAGLGVSSAARDDTCRALRMELNMWRYVERLIEQLHAEPDAPAPRP